MKTRLPPAKPTEATPEFFSTTVAKARRFYLDLNPSADRSLVVVCGGLEHCTPGYAIHRETFPYDSIEYVTRGRGDVKLKGRTFPLQPGRLFSYGPSTPHYISGVAAEPRDAKNGSPSRQQPVLGKTLKRFRRSHWLAPRIRR